MSKIKIAFVIESLGFGGREKILLEVANGLNAEIYEVHIITFSKDRNTQMDSLNKNIQFHALPFRNKNLVTPANILFAPFICGKFIRILKNIRPHIVHTHFLYQLFFLSAVGIKFSRCRCIQVHTIHTAGLYYTNVNTKNNFIIKTESYSISINHAYLITVSRQLQNICLQYFKNKAAGIKCIINGVDENKFDFHLRSKIKKSYWGFKEDDLIVSYVARFDKAQKDHLTLLKAWKIVVQKISNAKLCLAGDGGAKAEIEQFVKENELSSSVLLLGNISNINELLAISDVGVFTSRYEGLSVALLEKMFMKLPVVVTDIPAFTSVITDNISGYLFSPGNYKMLAEKIIELLTNRALRCEIGSNGYNAVKDYTINKMVENHDEYYKEILSAEGVS